MTNEKIIEVKNLTKKFGSFVANDNLNFEVNKGEIFGFLGANGAGKTTAIRQLCGLLKPTSGAAKVAGFDIFTEVEKVKKRIGYMSQKFSLYNDMTVYENLRFYGGIYGLSNKEIKERISYFIDILKLTNSKNTLLKDIPLGWKQKLAFSTALLHHPDIVFMDEPTGGVDPVTRRQFWEMIYKTANEGVTIFVTTHYMDEAEYCNRLSIMVEGKIIALDSPQNLVKKYQVKNMDEVFIKLARNNEN